MTLWVDYPEHLPKPGHIPKGFEWEALLDRVASLNPQTVAYKTADETIISNATYQDDDHLVVPVEAGGVYVYYISGGYNTNDTAQFKQRFSVPSGSFAGSYFWYTDQTNASVRQSYSSPTDSAIVGLRGKTADTPFDFGGVYTCGATGGTMQWQWAQNTSNASNTIVRAATRLQVTRVA